MRVVGALIWGLVLDSGAVFRGRPPKKRICRKAQNKAPWLQDRSRRMEHGKREPVTFPQKRRFRGKGREGGEPADHAGGREQAERWRAHFMKSAPRWSISGEEIGEE